jgi:hypothetical protein
MEKQQVSGYSDGPGSAHCKTVGLAYVGSNPTPATQNPRSEPLTRTCVSGSIAEKERFGRPSPVAVGQWWARFWLVSGSLRMGARGRRSRAVMDGADCSDPCFRRSGMTNLIWVEAPGSHCVPLGPAVARTHDGQDSGGLRRFLWASGGPAAGVEGFLDVLAGDLVAARYAVGIDGEQDADAVPGAGSDLGGHRRPATATARHDAGRRDAGVPRPAGPRRCGPGARSGRSGFR